MGGFDEVFVFERWNALVCAHEGDVPPAVLIESEGAETLPAVCLERQKAIQGMTDRNGG